MNPPRGVTVPRVNPEQEALRERELALAAEHSPAGLDAQHAAIAADRAARWAALLDGREELAGIREWAAQMAARHGRSVGVWRNRLPWIAALYVVRYGESEHFWPHTLTDDDLRRARQWAMGDLPNGVRVLAVEPR